MGIPYCKLVCAVLRLKALPALTSIALVGRQYGSEYVAAEEGAHSARRGIWAGEFELPAQWRRERKIDRLLSAPPLTVPALGASCSPTSAAQQCSKQQIGDCAGLLAALSLAEPTRVRIVNYHHVPALSLALMVSRWSITECTSALSCAHCIAACHSRGHVTVYG